jgi:predicted thioesterase
MDVGEQATQEFIVRDEDTAEAVGSGSLPVLATPRLLAWCEAVTCTVVDRSASSDSTSVGTRVQLEHVAASPVGARVSVTTTITYADGRLARFEVIAEHTTPAGEEKVIGHGEITRVVVDRHRFLARLPR